MIQKRIPSKADIINYKENVIIWHQHKEKSLSFMSSTNVMHQVMCHVPKYFDDPRGTGSVLCISSACLESQNKQFRDFVKNRSFRGSIIEQASDVLRQQYLSGTFRYSKLIEECTESKPQKCGSCGKHTRHNKRTCSGLPSLPEEECNTSAIEENYQRSEHGKEDSDSSSEEESDVFSESENDDDDHPDELSSFIPEVQKEMYNQQMCLKVPNDFFDKFYEVAEENNSKDVDGVETLAYIFGNNKEGIQRISHLVLMKQTGSHSGCEATVQGNVQIGNFSNKYPSLCILGWSHSHPR